ncbi:MAG: hypothetical protein IKI76_09045 [Selenomonadaceae bacterium]|nr:hypothetical protein [Selenomonadaceae bacterium]
MSGNTSNKVRLTSGNDTYVNTSEDATIAALGGNDTLSNSASEVSLNAGYDDDYVYNSGNSSRILGSEGSDTIHNDGDYSYFSGGEGKDLIYTYGSNYVTVNAGSSGDTVEGNFYSSSINGGSGSDSISISGSSNSIIGGTGDDTIYNYNGNSSYLSSGDGNDSIYAYVNGYVTVNAGSGKDTVEGSFYSSSINGGEGNDSIYAYSSDYVTVNAVSGSDTIEGEFDSSSIHGGSGNDSISISGSSNSIIGGTGDDTIYSYNGNSSYLSSGDGNDSIYAYVNGYVTVSAVSGSDTIEGTFYSSSIHGGSGNDLISIEGGYNTVLGGTGDDTIMAYIGSISGGVGADLISVNSSTSYSIATVKGGTGDDTIYGYDSAVLYQYSSGDGADKIFGFNKNSTLQIGGGSGSYSSQTSGDDVLISVGYSVITLSGAANLSPNIQGTFTKPIDKKKVTLTAGNDTYANTVQGATIAALGGDDYLSNTASNVSIDAGADDDYVYSTGNSSTILVGSGNDTIYNYGGNYSTLDAGSDNDYVINTGNSSKILGGDGADTLENDGNRVTIDAGTGNDTIINKSGYYVSINGGAGADVVSLFSNQREVTISGGKGDDIIYGSSNNSYGVLYQYSASDGSDKILNWSSSDSLTITGASALTSVLSGNDVLINVPGSGAITLGDAKGKTINVYPAITTTPKPKPIISQQEVIKKFMSYLDTTSYSGTTALNEAVRIATGGYFSNVQAAINRMISDCRSASSADEFLVNYCDIILDNADTGAITGSDEGGSSTKTAESIIPESGKLDTSFNASSFTTNGLTFYLSKTNLSSDELYIWRALKTWWANESLSLIKQSYGYSFRDSDVTFNETTVEFENTPGGFLASTNGSYLTINKYYYYNFSNTDVNGISPDSQAYLDRIISHELTHAVMMAKVNGLWDLPQFITEGMAELTHGIDDTRTGTILNLAKSPSALKSSLALTSGTGDTDAYAGGYMFLRYLAKYGSEHYGSSSSSVSKSASNSSIISSRLTLDEFFTADTVDLTTYPDKIKQLDATALDKGLTVFGKATANSITMGAGNDTVHANTGNDKIFGGAGDDILNGDAGNDSISGGTGDDILNGDAGNDSISGGTGDDTLSGGTGNDTLIGGAGRDVFLHKTDNDFISDYTAGEDSIKLAREHAKITSVSLNGKDVVLSVGSDSITVKDGKGKNITVTDYSGDTTSYVYGGKGNDSLWGSADADKFIYTAGDGNDIIFGFDSKDTLTLDNLAFTSSYKDNALTLTFDSGSVTFKEFNATTFHIDNDTYKISGSKLKKQ